MNVHTGRRPRSGNARTGAAMDELVVWRRRGIELPEHVARLLLGLVADGFTVRRCGPASDPVALVASYDWDEHVDLVTIRDFDQQVTAGRVVKQGGPVDVFAPETVVWTCEGQAESVLQSLLELVHPEHPAAPTVVSPAPISLYVARREQRPMAIRLPTPGRAGTRAARLGARLPPARPAVEDREPVAGDAWVHQRRGRRGKETGMSGVRVVACAVIGREHDVMVIRQPEAGWALPGAQVQPDERVEDALRRGVRETVGAEVSSASFLCLVEDTAGLFVVFDVIAAVEEASDDGRPQRHWVDPLQWASWDLHPASLLEALHVGEPPTWLPLRVR